MLNNYPKENKEFTNDENQKINEYIQEISMGYYDNISKETNIDIILKINYYILKEM